jgi:hypothetical protein
MRKRLIAPLILLLAASLLAGCLFDAVIDEKGGGTMTVKYRLTSEAQFRSSKRRFESEHVTLVDASIDDKKWATFSIKFDDVTKLPSTEFFARASVSLIDDGAGKTTLSVKYKNEESVQLLDELLEYFGNQVTMAVQLPGEVVETNAGESSGNAAKWTMPLSTFSKSPDLVLSVTYKTPSRAAASPAAAGAPTPPAAEPTAAAVPPAAEPAAQQPGGKQAP